MNIIISGFLAATVLATSASSVLAAQPPVRRAPANHVTAGRAFISPAYRARARSQVAYRHFDGQRWDGHRWIYYGEPAVGDAGIGAALFGIAALGLIQGATNY